MKLLFLILLPFFSIAQDSTYEPGDSTWITSSDTGKVKVYKELCGGEGWKKMAEKYGTHCGIPTMYITAEYDRDGKLIPRNYPIVLTALNTMTPTQYKKWKRKHRKNRKK